MTGLVVVAAVIGSLVAASHRWATYPLVTVNADQVAADGVTLGQPWPWFQSGSRPELLVLPQWLHTSPIDEAGFFEVHASRVSCTCWVFVYHCAGETFPDPSRRFAVEVMPDRATGELEPVAGDCLKLPG